MAAFSHPPNRLWAMLAASVPSVMMPEPPSRRMAVALPLSLLVTFQMTL
jgi:hypothetical protein